MFRTRLLSGIILVILAIGIVGKGGMLLFAVNTAISLIGLFELYRVYKIEDKILGIIGYLSVLLYYGLIYYGKEGYIVALLVISLMVFMLSYVFAFPKYTAEQVMAAFFGIVYAGMMLSYLYAVRSMADGEYMAWLIFLSSWGCDTSAYCFGKMLGKHKLAPILSPKKSIEGAVGGVIGATLLGYAFGFVFGHRMDDTISPELICAGACAIASVISQIGDLAASGIKRNHDVKDYGNLIPGHGGILDRFDSMIFTAPAIFYAITFIQNIYQ